VSGQKGGQAAPRKRTTRAKPAAKPAAKSTGLTAVEVVPDVAGDAGALTVIVDLLHSSQMNQLRYEAVRVARGDSLDDPVAGLPPTREDGTVNSYRLAAEEAKAEERRLLAWKPHLADKVRELVKKRQESGGQ
jgi:hypothetical protein